MVETKAFAAGQVIFREGEPPKEAYRILSGKVAIAMAGPAKPVILAQLTAGDVFGEMGLIDERPRSASAVALEATNVEVVTLDSLNHMIFNQPQNFMPFLRAFFERLRSMNDRLRMELKLKGAAAPAQAATSAKPMTDTKAITAQAELSITLVPMSDRARAALGGESLEIRKFPFRIGRSSGGGADAFAMNDLSIADTEPYQVSRSHCAFEREGDKIVVHDRGSRCGTIVNDTAIGGSYEGQQLELVKGRDNTLILGEDHSPYLFEVRLK